MKKRFKNRGKTAAGILLEITYSLLITGVGAVIALSFTR